MRTSSSYPRATIVRSQISAPHTIITVVIGASSVRVCKHRPRPKPNNYSIISLSQIHVSDAVVPTTLLHRSCWCWYGSTTGLSLPRRSWSLSLRLFIHQKYSRCGFMKINILFTHSARHRRFNGTS